MAGSINSNARQLTDVTPSKWDKVRVSSRSMFPDMEWDLRGLDNNPNLKASDHILLWDFELPNGQRFGEQRYAIMRQSVKELVYATMKDKGHSPATVDKNFTDFRSIVKWVVEKEYIRFSDVRKETLSTWVAEINLSTLHPVSKFNLLRNLQRFWQYKDKLTDTFVFDPLGGKKANQLVGATKQELKDCGYDYIPDDTAQDLVRKAVDYIRGEGVKVATAAYARDMAELECFKQGKSKSSRDRHKRAALKGMGITNAEVTTESRSVLSACFIVIDFFTGVRASEMFSFKRDQIAPDEGSVKIKGRITKIKKKDKEWMAPPVVYEAYKLATMLTAAMRESLDYEIEMRKQERQKAGAEAKAELDTLIVKLSDLREDLFILWSADKHRTETSCTHSKTVNSAAGAFRDTYLKEFARKFNVLGPDGEVWDLHAHQFRKTFARYMAANMMNLRYLQEHYGHDSLDMTAWYDPDEIELTHQILSYLKEFKKNTVRHMLEGQRMTGAGAKHIDSERKIYFMGMTSDKEKETFIEELADDVVLRSTGHSWCLGNTDNGDCTGSVCCMFDPANVKQCESAVVTEDHLPVWQEMERANQEVLDTHGIGKYQKQAIERLLEETIRPTIVFLLGEAEPDETYGVVTA